MRFNTTVFIIIILIFACTKEYERSNPFDPDYTGVRTRIISIYNHAREEYSGNLDNIINKGEEFKIYISIVNKGNSVTNDVKANIDISSSSVSYDDFYSVLKWGNILPDSVSNGQGGISQPEAVAYIETNKTSPVGEDFKIYFDFFDELNNHWKDSLSFIVEETNAILLFDTLTIESGPYDVNHFYFKFYPYLKNIGISSTQDVWSISSIPDDSVQLAFGGDDPVFYGDIQPNESKTCEFPYPEFRISKSLPTPYTFKMRFEIYDTYDNYWYDSTFVTID